MLRQNLIDEYIESISTSLGGIKAPIDPEPLEQAFREGRLNRLVRTMMDLAHLNHRMQIAYVRNGGPGQSPVWIKLRTPCPLYGTRAFQEMKPTLYVRKKFFENVPFETIVAGIAHELSHIILWGTHHPLRTLEEATDITAMLIGYVTFFEKGSHYIEGHLSQKLRHRIMHHLFGISTYEKIIEMRQGYLSQEEIEYAAKIIRERQT